MGLHAVPKFLREKHGHLLQKEHISLFAYQRVFMDIASWIYKSVCINGTDNNRWINSLLRLIYMFRLNKVNIVPVFDGKAPAEKLAEQQARRETRAKTKDRLKGIRDAIDAYNHGERSEETLAILTSEISGLEKKGLATKSILKALKIAQSEEAEEKQEISITPAKIAQLEQLCLQLQRQTTFIGEDDNKFMRDIFESCGISWIQAPEEAEAYCCWLVRNGFGNAVISCDTDCIAHRADIFIFDLETKTGDITFVNLEDLLVEWKLTEEQIVDFATLVGCDYNPGSRKNKIGPVKAISLLQKYGKIENIPDLIDIECLHVEKCRRLFNPEYPLEVVIKAGYTDVEKMYAVAKTRPDVDRELCMKMIEVNNKKAKIVIKK